MKGKFFAAILLLAFVFKCTTAYATLIGDTITIAHHGPTISEIFASRVTVVQPGVVDDVVFLGPLSYTINPEASSVHVGFQANGTFSASRFNGLVVSSIDDTITGYAVETNFEGWSDSRVTFDAHSFSANFAGLPSTPRTFLAVRLTTTPVGVPDRGSSLALLAPAILGLAAGAEGIRRRTTLIE